jgi:hypothetical protein
MDPWCTIDVKGKVGKWEKLLKRTFSPGTMGIYTHGLIFYQIFYARGRQADVLFDIVDYRRHVVTAGVSMAHTQAM